MKSCARFFAFLGFLLLASQSPALAEQDLDQDALRAAVAQRVSLILSQRSEPDTSIVPTEAITINQVQPVQTGEVRLYAVKLTLKAQGRVKEVFTEPEEMILLTDRSGKIQFSVVTDIATGEEAAMVHATSLTEVVFPPHLAKPFLNGTGQKEVVLISDPFCPYCRQALTFLTEKLSRIATLSLVHLPLAMHPGADAAAWIMEFAREEVTALYKQIVDFAYTGLRAPGTENDSPTGDEDAQRNVIRQFLEKFPKLTVQPAESFLYYLKEKYERQDLATRQELKKLRISGTPVVIIDGQAIQGFDQKEIEKRLSK